MANCHEDKRDLDVKERLKLVLSREPIDEDKDKHVYIGFSMLSSEGAATPLTDPDWRQKSFEAEALRRVLVDVFLDLLVLNTLHERHTPLYVWCQRF